MTHSIQSGEKYSVTLHGLIIPTNGDQCQDASSKVKNSTPYPSSDRTVFTFDYYSTNLKQWNVIFLNSDHQKVAYVMVMEFTWKAIARADKTINETDKNFTTFFRRHNNGKGEGDSVTVVIFELVTTFAQPSIRFR